MHAGNIIKDKHKKNESNVITYFTTSDYLFKCSDIH